MQREIHQWYSPRLNKDMEIAVYGHYGFALLMFPTAAADYLEYERFQLLARPGSVNQRRQDQSIQHQQHQL
jgi:esterase/lipase superfamily enzyme